MKMVDNGLNQHNRNLINDNSAAKAKEDLNYAQFECRKSHIFLLKHNFPFFAINLSMVR